MKKNNKGFSLVELIIVIAIMAVLVGVLAPQFIKYVEQSRRSRDIQTAAEIREACLADIADDKISAAVSTYTAVGTSTFTTFTEDPKVNGHVTNNGGSFYYICDPVAGTCSVAADSAGSWVLTTDVGASSYKASGT
jgi:type IV pilus assembly protein PilA